MLAKAPIPEDSVGAPKPLLRYVNFVITAPLADGQAHRCYWACNQAFSPPAASLRTFHEDMDIS